MAGPDDDFTLGVEEEYLLVDPGTRELVPASPKVLARSQPELGELGVQHELFLAQVEIGTPVCRTLGELREHLTGMRRQLAAGARASGCRIAAAGTHPFSSWRYQQVTPRRRYLEFVADYQQIAREQVLCGCHIHVGIADPEAALQTMNRVQPWLTPLLALAGNSPFWLGADTGYASYRTQLWRRWPTAESAGTFASRADYDQLVASLVEVGAIQDATHIWWDVRPSAKYPTIEFRVTDVTTQQLVPAPLLVERFLTHLRPALEEHQEWDEVADLVDATMTRGPGAERQRAAYARTGRFEDVVDQVVAETATPWPQVSRLGTNRM